MVFWRPFLACSRAHSALHLPVSRSRMELLWRSFRLASRHIPLYSCIAAKVFRTHKPNMTFRGQKNAKRTKSQWHHETPRQVAFRTWRGDPHSPLESCQLNCVADTLSATQLSWQKTVPLWCFALKFCKTGLHFFAPDPQSPSESCDYGFCEISRRTQILANTLTTWF